MAIPITMDWLNITGAPKEASFNRAERILPTLSFVVAVSPPKARLPCAKCKATSTRQSATPPYCRGAGRSNVSEALKQQAERLRYRFEEAFWCDDLGTYALALDGKKRPCRVRAPNPGHCLFTGIASPEQAKRVGKLLLSEELFSGWGVRTLSSHEVRYNAMSYHNGSVWPHDNALIAAGIARYSDKEGAAKILTGFLDASIFLDLHRLPELFCGFPRREGEGPTLYPVACAPQAWAAASIFLLLQACLGLEIQTSPPSVLLHRAELPEARLSILKLSPRTKESASPCCASPPTSTSSRSHDPPQTGKVIRCRDSWVLTAFRGA